MNPFDTLNSFFRTIPGWLRNVFNLITLLVGFIVSFRNDKHLYSVIIFILGFVYLLTLFIIVIFKKDRDIFGQPVYRYRPHLRITSALFLVIVIGTSAIIIRSEKGQEYITFARYGTPTPTATQIPTITPSLPPPPIPTSKPISDLLYYMVVYDSSINMGETFHSEDKWQVARNLLVEIMNGLSPNAQYNMAIIGGSTPTDGTDPCNQPDTPSLTSFSSKQQIYNLLKDLSPQGGGSFYKAYALAKNHFQTLPVETIRTLIFITGTNDTCENEDEWTAIQNLISIEDSTFGTYSQIVILDDDGIKSRTLAEQFNSLSNENLKADAPQSVSEIQSGGVTVVQIINNANTYVEKAVAALPTNTPTNTIVPTETYTPTITATFKPGETRTAPPINTPTSTPTNTQTLTPTFTRTASPTFTKSITPSATLPAFGIKSPLNNASLSCQINEDCMITVTVQWITNTQASNQGLYLSVWVKPYPGDSNYLFYSQTQVTHIDNGLWKSDPVIIGQKDVDPPGTPFAIYAIVTTQSYETSIKLSSLPPHSNEWVIGVTR